MIINMKTDSIQRKLIIPFWLAKIIIKIVSMPISKKYIPLKYKEYVEAINPDEFDSLVHILKKYKGLTLVEVHSKDGTNLSITI